MSFRYTIETENPIVIDGNKMFNCNDGKLRLKIVEANPWHTGTPTEKGWYMVKANFEEHPYYAMKFEDGSFWDYDDNDPHFVRITPDFIDKWQKIEPYRC